MDEKVVKVIIEAFIKELIGESKSIFNTLYDEGKQFIGTSVRKYLERQKIRFSSIKTLLKGNTPVFLYEIYYPLKLKDAERVMDTNLISKIFHDGNYFTIIGDAGSGKSTLVKHLFLSSIKEKFAIPVLVELRYMNSTNGNFDAYISQKIFDNKISANENILQRLYESGRFLFFLDGFDELNSDVRNAVLESMNNFISLYPENKFIVTTRPFSNIESLSNFRNYQVKNLDEKEINGFIDLQLKAEPELADKIKLSLKESKSTYIKSFLANPLLLSLYILTFQTYAEIPDKKYIFYRRVINALFSEHDSKTKLGYVREKQSQLSQEQFEEILKAFSFLSYFDEHFNFDFDYIDTTLRKIKQRIGAITFDTNKFIYDLKSAIALWVEDNGQYSFAHRSLQEYFAASFIKNLNPEDKERAYKTIINKFSDAHTPLAEYKNFLSLCNEMDEINFYQHYYIPLMKELRATLDNSSREKLVRSFVLFFTERIDFSTNSHSHLSKPQKHLPLYFAEIKVKQVVYKTIYLHLEYTQRLYDLLQQVFTNVGSSVDNNQEANGTHLLRFNSEDEIIKYCTDSRFYNIANEFLIFIEKEISSKEKFIKQAFKADRDLLDLIT